MAISEDPIPDSTPVKPPRPQWRVPQSLRLFVAVQLLFAISSIVWVIVADCRMMNILNEIRRVDGRYRLREGGPNWLRNLIGSEWMLGFDEIVLIRLRSPEDAEAALSRFRGLASVQEVDLSGTQVTDAALVNLKGMVNLQLLNLKGTRITDAGLQDLNGFTKLRVLLIDDGLVTQAAVKELEKSLPDLRVEW